MNFKNILDGMLGECEEQMLGGRVYHATCRRLQLVGLLDQTLVVIYELGRNSLDGTLRECKEQMLGGLV